MKFTRIIAIDLAKSVFQVCLIVNGDKVLVNKSLRRNKLASWLAKQAAALVAMEACGGAHHWARMAKSLGHRAMIIPPRQVKPYRQGQKTDPNDALAIGIAAQQANIKTVATMSLEQQSVQADKRIQEHLSDQQTATSNSLRALVSEFGIVIAKGSKALRQRMPAILDDADNGLPDSVRPGLRLLYRQWRQQREALELIEVILRRRANELEACRRLSALEGVGYKNAIGLYIRVGDGTSFKNGREAAACTGLTPKQSSSGGKVRLGSIGKYKGDQRLRASLITGAWAVVRVIQKRPAKTTKERWLKALIERRGPSRAAVALANKNLRTAWAMMRYNSVYQTTPLAI